MGNYYFYQLKSLKECVGNRKRNILRDPTEKILKKIKLSFIIIIKGNMLTKHYDN